MKKIIVQHSTSEQQAIIDLVKPINQKYADALGYEYIVDTNVRCPERPFFWEKFACLIELLGKTEEGSLVVWEDADSLNLKNISFESALPAGGIFGMTKNRGGMNNSKFINWYNSGVMVMINNAAVREFLQNVWNHGGRTDEDGIMEELKLTDYMVGDKPVSAIDPKWNCWKNNAQYCLEPVVKTFHGMNIPAKIIAIQETLAYVN